jgi:hypothetical protein
MNKIIDADRSYAKAKNGRLHLTAINFGKKLVYGGIIKPSILAETAKPETEIKAKLIKKMGIGDM